MSGKSLSNKSCAKLPVFGFTSFSSISAPRFIYSPQSRYRASSAKLKTACGFYIRVRLSRCESKTKSGSNAAAGRLELNIKEMHAKKAVKLYAKSLHFFTPNNSFRENIVIYLIIQFLQNRQRNKCSVNGHKAASALIPFRFFSGSKPAIMRRILVNRPLKAVSSL